MTVSELVELLADMPPDALVLTEGRHRVWYANGVDALCSSEPGYVLIGNVGQRYEARRTPPPPLPPPSAEDLGRQWCCGKGVEFVSARFQDDMNLLIDIIVDPDGERQEKTVGVLGMAL